MLVRAYQQKVYWLVRKMVIDHDDADDLTQEVFIKIHKAIDNFREDSQLFTWIYRIATNECLTFLNKKKRRFFLPIEDVSKELTAKIDSAPYLSGDDIQKKLQKALLTLPDPVWITMRKTSIGGYFTHFIVSNFLNYSWIKIKSIVLTDF